MRTGETIATPLPFAAGLTLANAGAVMSTVVNVDVKRAAISFPTRSFTCSTRML